jgi:hypothetical protein
MPRNSKGLEEDDIESPVETFTDRYRMCETRARRPGMHVQRSSVDPTQSFTMLHQSTDAPRCPSFNHTTTEAAPMSHNLTSGSTVDTAGRSLRNRQVDVGRCELEGLKELFQVFSLTQRHVTPDGNCMPLSVAEKNTDRICTVETNVRKSTRNNTRVVQ